MAIDVRKWQGRTKRGPHENAAERSDRTKECAVRRYMKEWPGGPARTTGRTRGSHVWACFQGPPKRKGDGM